MAEGDRNEDVRERVRKVARRQAARKLQRDRAETDYVEQAVAWLVEKWGEGKACPYCGVAHWNVGPPVDIPGWQGAVSQWFMPVSCANCAQTTFINVVDAGLDPFGEDEEEDE